MNLQALQQTTKVRDLTVWKLTEENWIVIAIDGLGGIGQMPYDEVAAEPQDVGYFTARVALFELLSANVTPNILINSLSVGGIYAKKIVDGIREAALEAGLGDDFPITGSSEDNVPAKLTALGVTAMGSVERQAFWPGKAMPEDEVWLVGKPKSAPADAVYRGDSTSISFSQLKRLQTIPNLHEILPVGSKGAFWEASQIAATAGLRWSPFTIDSTDIGLHSGGPATAVVIAGQFTSEPEWVKLSSELPCRRLGTLEKTR
jgi:hypothetical protein